MKKIPLLITAAILVVLTGLLFLFHHLSKPDDTSAWDLVPAETVLVYESGECSKCVADLQNLPMSQLIKRAVLYSQSLDSLTQIGDLVTSFQQPTLVSLHITRKENFDFVFYLPFNTNTELRLNLLLDKFKKTKNVRMSSREYDGVTINEVAYGKSTFSWIVVDDIWVGSFTPILVEDVIRTHKNETSQTFRKAITLTEQLPKRKKDGGNLYIHLQNFASWLSLFSNTASDDLVRQFGQSAWLDVSLNDDQKLVLNGFSVERSATDNFVLSAFQDQSPIPFELKQFVPNRSLLFTSYGISDGNSFLKGLKKIRKNATDSLALISSELKVDITSVLNSFSGEIGISWAEGRKESVSKILLVKNSKGVEPWLQTFNTLSEKLSIDTVFYEKYGDYEIREVPVYRFPEKLLGPLVSGFERTYYTSSGNVIIIAEDFEFLKKYIDDIDKEDTWGKSVAQNTFLESTLLESNISLFINTPRLWHILEKSLTPRWRSFVDENEILFNSLGMGSIQFSHLNDSYYTNISWEANLKTATTGRERTTDKILVNLDKPIATFSLVRNHQDKTDEILLQDSAKDLSLVSPEGKVLWKVALPDFIVSEIYQIDFLANGKLQYLFATPGQLHVIDRLGNYVAPYPISIKEQDIRFVSVVDYDHTRKYRFLVTGRDGKLWMYDKEGKNLEGWTPRIIDEGVSTTPRHHRLAGKDYIVAIRTDGYAYLMNRRGELLKNFPLDLDARFLGDYYVEPGKTRRSTDIVTVSREGARIRFNLEGSIQSKEVLVKNTPDARFWLVAAVDMDGYLIVRQESKQLTILDEQLNEIIKSDFIGNNPVSIRYENFGNGKNYIVLTDLSQDLSFVYTSTGTLLTTLPVDSHALVVNPDPSGRVKMYSWLGGNLTITDLP